MFKGMQEHHQSETIKRKLSTIQHESKAANNVSIYALVVVGLLGLTALGNIQEKSVGQREAIVQQKERELQMQQQQYQPNLW